MSKEAEVKSKRPPDDAFRQQKLSMFQPIMTPIKVIFLFLAIGIAFVPAGVSMLQASNLLFEASKTYDDGSSSSPCYIDTSNAQKVCDVQFDIDRDFSGPLYVYYQLTNFYQNHRRYVTSRDTNQLAGEQSSEDELKNAGCSQEYLAPDMDHVILNPCGLIANSFFTDVFFLTSAPKSDMELDESGIAWESDKEKFVQPKGFEHGTYTCNDPTTIPTNKCASSCELYNETINSVQTCYWYTYPDASKNKYLYQTYNLRVDYKTQINPNPTSKVVVSKALISPINGVTDEHFMVWMRTAALPTFRKLYGRIDGDFKKGDTVSFQIQANYVTESFKGTKSLVVSNLNDLGGKNPYLGISYIVVGSLSLLFGSLFALKNIISPRPIGSPRLLPWS